MVLVFLSSLSVCLSTGEEPIEGEKLSAHDEHRGSIRSLYYDDGIVYTGGLDDFVIAYDIQSRSKLWEHDEHEGTVRSIHVEDGIVYSCSEDRTVIAYQISDYVEEDESIPGYTLVLLALSIIASIYLYEYKQVVGKK